MKKLFLIDGHALIFRMYYAFLRRPMINSKGEDTSILFGFTKYILELARREKPTHLAIAFDPPCKTFRHELDPDYKANRAETPELIKSSLEPLIKLMEALDIPVIMVPGFEADDVIGSMAKRWEAAGFDVFMVSPDKDLGQLVSDHIYQYKPAKGTNTEEIVGREALCKKYGIQDPIQIIDILTLWGDASDNVRGVRGIGEVGAKKLVAQYGSVEGILASLDKLTAKQQEAFREAESYIRQSRELVTIRTDIPLDVTEQALLLRLQGSAQSRQLFRHYEFSSLLPLLPASEAEDDLPEALSPQSQSLRSALELVKIGSLKEVEKAARNSHRLALNYQAPEWLVMAENTVYRTNDPHTLIPLFTNNQITKVGYDLKGLWKVFREQTGQPLQGELADLEVMHYLLNPESSHLYDTLAISYLGLDPKALEAPEDPTATTAQPQPEPDLFSAFFGDPAPATPSIDPEQRRAQWQQAVLLLPLHDALLRSYQQDEKITRLYREIEMPLIPVLAGMEEEGFRIDCQMLADYSKQLQTQADQLETRIRELAEDPQLNVASPKQLGLVLFEKLQLDPKAKKNKSGSYSTDEETLLELQDKHPIVSDILRFRELKKLINTYIDPFPSFIAPNTGKIHTTFNQALTATGRLSSVKPNLQNIPIRSELGREIRRAFIPSDDNHLLVSADYSQIELRLMAILSQDPGMLEDFRMEKDIHTATAARIFHISEEAVTREQRSRAKTANFGIIYGISAFGLAQRLNLSRTEAKELIDEYFRSYPQVRAYMEQTKETARSQSFVETLYGRKRYLPAITSRNAVVRGLAERNAINAPLQGTAADLIKIAMIRVDQRLRQEGLQSKLILQVHDELIVDALKTEVEAVKQLLKEEMEHVANLAIPLTVECNSGVNWLDAH